MGELLGEGVVALAELDRLLHQSHVLSIRGERDWLREKRQGGTIPVSTRRRETFGYQRASWWSNGTT